MSKPTWFAFFQAMPCLSLFFQFACVDHVSNTCSIVFCMLHIGSHFCFRPFSDVSGLDFPYCCLTKVCKYFLANNWDEAEGYAPRTPISSRPLARPPKMVSFSENGTFCIFMNIIQLPAAFPPPCPHGAPPGPLLGFPGLPLDPFWVPLDPFWVPLGFPWSPFGSPWTALGLPWAPPGFPLDPIGAQVEKRDAIYEIWLPFWLFFGSPGPPEKIMKVCNRHQF